MPAERSRRASSLPSPLSQRRSRPCHSSVTDPDYEDRLPTSGTVAQLYTSIKSHLDTHPELATNSRFAGLFNARHRHTVAECPRAGESVDETTT